MPKIKWRIKAGVNEETTGGIARRTKVGRRDTARALRVSALALEERIDLVVLECCRDMRCVCPDTGDRISAAFSNTGLHRETITEPELETGEILLQEDVHNATDRV